jgi:hypothetical protein
MTPFGIVVACEDGGSDELGISHLKKINDGENNFLNKGGD